MTSSRAQNVSTFQNPLEERWKLPIASFTDTGGSLISVHRNSCIGKNATASEKSCGQRFKNFSTVPYGNSQNKDYTFTNTSPNALMTNSLNSMNRELSPVRWCDRKVDGVYLGRSGWVQVQQRSLDDGKGAAYSENNIFSTLPTRKHYSDVHSTRRDRGKCNRPVDLPLPLKKRAFRENFERPTKFAQELESVSPPSVTPIISPPPAFKDDGSNDFPSRSRKPFYSEESFLLKPEGSCLGKERRSNTQSFSSPGSTESSISLLKQDRCPYRGLKTKSLEESSNALRRNGRYNSVEPFTVFGFRSLDNDARTGGSVIKVNESDSYYNVENPREIMCDKCDKEDVEDNRSNDGANSKGYLNGQKNFLKEFRQRNYLRNGRRTPNSHRTRSSSSDSSSSSRSSSSSGFSGKSSRRPNSKEKQVFEFENATRKQFYVKRSRSLQLSEKRSPNDASIPISNSSSGKSWDPMPPECSTSGQTKGQEGERSVQFPQHLHHVLVTVSGDSIPVGGFTSHTLNSLNKITTSEEEQRKLIMEAEKEARIISEFLNGTRSRTAARNLLMHRYLNKHEDESSVDSSENSPSKSFDRDVYFLETDRRVQTNPNFSNYDRGSFCKKKKSSNVYIRQQPTAMHSKPFASIFRTSGTVSSRSVTCFQNAEEPKKKDRSGSKGYSVFSGHYARGGLTTNAKVKSEASDRCQDDSGVNSTVEKSRSIPWRQKQKTKNETIEGEAEGVKCSFKQQVLPSRKLTGMEGQRFEEGSSPSSSSSAEVDFGTPKILDDCDPFEGEKNPIGVMDVTFEPGSAHGSDESISLPVDQRSLSLPRSFLSQRHISKQRDFLMWKQQYPENLEEATDELSVISQRSRTAPTTPTHDMRQGKSSENLNRIQCTGSSHTSPSDESPFPNSHRIGQKIIREKEEHSNEGNPLVIYKNLLQISENSPETVLQKLRKKFSLRYLKAKENLRDFDKSADEDIESERGGRNTNEANPVVCRLMSDLQTVRIDDQVSEKALRFTKQLIAPKKSLKNEKYDSHDSGIQMGNRGNVDSSESQDTDFLEDVDSPVVARRRGIRAGDNFCRTESETSDQTVTNILKADFQLRTKIAEQNYRKGVRRTNSDVGCQKLVNRSGKNPGVRFPSHPAPIKDQNAKIVWELPSPEDTALRGRFIGSQLRRSLSQPLGLNEMPTFSRSSILKCFALSEDEKNQRGKNSEDEFLSDSESSVASLLERKKSSDYASREEATILAEAVWDHVAIESFELPFRAGDVIEVLDTQNWDWWWGATAENRGYFPSAFVRLRVNQEDTVEDCLAAMAKGNNASSRLRKGKTVSLLSNDQVRSSVVRELLNTERDFVKILRDLKDGYVEQCRRRMDMFSSAQIAAIFSNLEDLLVFQEKFLNDLETKVDREFPYKSCIGQVFLTHGSGFRMYSEYCNSHPMAIATLQDLYQNSSYCKFFETCRLKQSLIEIPLHGYLLTPVQRICKYPLQLAELLKYTKPDHPDFKEVGEALETMRTVATLINERKRKMESLEKLAAWQQRVEGWEGEDLIEISSQLIHQGDVVRITSGVWTSNITLFLFDHQIVYCKKDLLKRNVYIYKGRIFLDASVVVDVPDGKHQQLGVTVKYGLKICSSLKDKWLLFCCRSSEDKAKWLEALAEEKRLVAQDKEVGLDLPPAAKRLAKLAARTKNCPPCKPRGKNKIASNRDEMSFRNCHPNVSKTKSSRRVGNWFTFSGVMKNSKANPRPRTSLHQIT